MWKKRKHWETVVPSTLALFAWELSTNAPLLSWTYNYGFSTVFWGCWECGHSAQSTAPSVPEKSRSHYGGLTIGSSYMLLLPFIAPYHGASDHNPCPSFVMGSCSCVFLPCKLSTGSNCLVGIKEGSVSRLSPLSLGAGKMLLDLVFTLIEVMWASYWETQQVSQAGLRDGLLNTLQLCLCGPMTTLLSSRPWVQWHHDTTESILSRDPRGKSRLQFRTKRCFPCTCCPTLLLLEIVYLDA